MQDFNSAVRSFGNEAATKLKGPGQREALLRTPIDNLLKQCGDILGLKVVPHDEVSEASGSVRPDYAINVNGVITGHVELKAPGVSLDPSTYGKTTHNYKQWEKLRELPNLIYTNGIEWRLWRQGKLVGSVAHLVGAADLVKAHGKLAATPNFIEIVTDFFRWKPSPISTVTKLVEAVAPLTRHLKDQVRAELVLERMRIRAGEPADQQVFLGLRSDWRNLLFPRATDEEFADGYSQSITFALLLAQAEGADLLNEDLHAVGKDLHESHSLMGRTLQLLTDQLDDKFLTAVELMMRVISAVDWPKIENGKNDVYLHLYENFLQVYDYEARKKTGSYYTPVEVVDQMVRLTEDVLAQVLDRPDKFRDPRVSVIDPAMGTGTYPLSIMRRVADQATKAHGRGAAPEALSNLVSRLYGFELQSGPFSVAELRISGLLKESGAKLPKAGLQLFVTNTLSDPESKQQNLGSALQLIAQQSQRASQVKREKNIQVVIGNPPYMENAGGLGDWVENGNGLKGEQSLMADFKEAGKGVYERKAKNLYVYFWRWALWKVFESTNSPKEPNGDTGVISFITAQGYLTGPGFAGMRRHMRQQASKGWIINLTPEDKRPPQKNAIFSIETPVGIGIFVRDSDTSNDEPADIKYISLSGTREEKFTKLAELTLDSPKWKNARTGWTAPFTAAAQGDWDDFPAMHDIFGWWQQGMVAARTWVYAPTKQVLAQRWRTVALGTDKQNKSALFTENRDTHLSKGQDYLPSVETAVDPTQPFNKELGLTEPPFERIGYRSFDRQWVIADKRVIHNPRPYLWESRGVNQVFVTEQHTSTIESGPALTFTNLVPDMHHFNMRGGRVLPLLHPNGEPDITKGLAATLATLVDKSVSAEDVLAYVAGVASHPGFTVQFAEELMTPGIRIPFTSDGELWTEAVELGRTVIWLHTYGKSYADHQSDASILSSSKVKLPSYEKSVDEMPENIHYDSIGEVLHVGIKGEWHAVSQAVRDYEVGGRNIVDTWFKYRLRSPITKGVSNLDLIVQEDWPGEWSLELTELLSVLTRLVDLEPSQASLLGKILEKPLLGKQELSKAGVSWPTGKMSPRREMTLELD